MVDLLEHLHEALEACVERGMQLPFIMCAISPNGCVSTAAALIQMFSPNTTRRKASARR